MVLDGPATIGPGNKFFAFASIGQRTQDLKYSEEPTWVEIGANNTFREYTTVNRSTFPDGCTKVGSHGNFLAYSHIGHDSVVGDHAIFSNNGTLAGHVEVQNHVGLGGLTAVHQFCRLGRFSFTGGCAKIVQDLPPFFLADGNPACVRGINKTGLERNGFTPEQIKLIAKAYRILYREELNVSQACQKIRDHLEPTAEIQELLSFIENSSRGIIRKSSDE